MPGPFSGSVGPNPTLTVKEVDGNPTVRGVNTIKVSNATLTDDGSGAVTIAIGSGTGDVLGPASSTDNALARFNGAGGKTIQNSAVIVADTTGNMSGMQKVTIGVPGTATGSIELQGTTSGVVTIKTADAAGTWALTLPANDGDSGQYLQTDGSGVASWQTVTAGPTINATDGVIPYRSSSSAFSDSSLVREDANTVAQRNGTNKQAFHIYNTISGTYERASFEWPASPNEFVISTNGTSGSSRDIVIDASQYLFLRSRGGFIGIYDASKATIITIDLAAKALTWNTDNSGSIGTAGAGRPATLYLGTGLAIEATITPAATVGAQTINKTAGSVNFAAGAASLVVTCDKCTVNSLVFAVIAANDTTATIKNVVAASGSFTITLTASATAETRVNFWILQPD